MNKEHSDQDLDPPPTPQEERAADLRLLAELVEIQMSIARATQQEALQAPQPGVDYGQRIATVARSVRLTLLLKRKLADERNERRKAAARREAAQEDWHALRVKLAMTSAVYEVSEDGDEADRRAAEMAEQLERPEVVELVEASRVEVAWRLCAGAGAIRCRRSAGWRWPTRPWRIWASCRRRTTIRLRTRPSPARPVPAAASPRPRTRGEGIGFALGEPDL